MSRGAQPFTQNDVTKALKGAAKAGLEVQRVEIERGKIVLVTGKPTDISTPPFPVENPWDNV